MEILYYCEKIVGKGEEMRNWEGGEERGGTKIVVIQNKYG